MPTQSRGHGTQWLLILVGALTPAAAQAQAERYEIGQRLCAMETAWDEQPSGAARRRAAPHLKKAVASFFALQPDEAARAFDLARFALRSAQEPAAEVLWAESLFLRLHGKLVDPADGSLDMTLAPFYATPAVPPAKIQVAVSILDMVLERTVATAALPVRLALALKDRPAGEYSVRLEIHAGGKLLVERTQRFSCVNGRDRRLAALKQAVDSLPRQPTRAEVETIRAQLQLLERLAARQVLETDYPASRLFDEVENRLAALTAGKDYATRPGQYWLTVATEKNLVPLRLLVPDAVDQGKPLPLVIALHGAGGSENLFFEGYGRGVLVKECQQRGWLLAAPRGPGFGGTVPLAPLIDELARLYPVERKKVFLVGHSLGANQAVAAAGLAPERLAGVAALGGGGTVNASEALKQVPFFIGVGSEDFLLGPARTLTDKLRQAGVKKVEQREYPGIEHMMIVPVCMKDMLAFFEEVLRP